MRSPGSTAAIAAEGIRALLVGEENQKIGLCLLFAHGESFS